MTREFEPTPQPTHQKFIIVRHGEDVFINDDDHLTDQGKEQGRLLSVKIAEFLGPKLLQPGMSVVLTSEAAKCREFAEIIAKGLGERKPYIRQQLGDKNGKVNSSYTSAEDIRNFTDPIGGFKGVVIVTHSKLTEELPIILLGVDYPNNNYEGLFRGTAYAIDVDEYREAYDQQHRIPENISGEAYYREREHRLARLRNATIVLRPHSSNRRAR